MTYVDSNPNIIPETKFDNDWIEVKVFLKNTRVQQMGKLISDPTNKKLQFQIFRSFFTLMEFTK